MESMTYLYLCTKALIYRLFQEGRVLAQDERLKALESTSAGEKDERAEKTDSE